MKIYIDESGSFSSFQKGSISVVGALAIPDGKLEKLQKKYHKIRVRLPKENGEVKGRLLNEDQINEVIELLAKNEVLFEVSALDLGVHTEDGVKSYKRKHGEGMLARVSLFNESVQEEVRKASQEVLDTPVQLYLQALTTFELLHRLIGHMTLYYSQRRPHELGSIAWIVDGKDPKKVTKWETWCSSYARGALATMSIKRPSPHFEGGDYSFFDKSYGTEDEKGPGTDLKLLLKDISFVSEPICGLEFIDILSNAVRRALTGNLKEDGWQHIRRLMVHRNESPYIQFIMFSEGSDEIRNAEYGVTVRKGFSSGGKSMLTPSNLAKAEEEEAAEAKGDIKLI